MRVVQLKKPYSTMSKKKAKWRIKPHTYLESKIGGNEEIITKYEIQHKERYGLSMSWENKGRFDTIEIAEEHLMKLKKLEETKKNITIKYYE